MVSPRSASGKRTPRSCLVRIPVLASRAVRLASCSCSGRMTGYARDNERFVEAVRGSDTGAKALHGESNRACGRNTGKGTRWALPWLPTADRTRRTGTGDRRIAGKRTRGPKSSMPMTEKGRGSWEMIGPFWGGRMAASGCPRWLHLPQGKVAGVAGLEPVTSAVTGQRSNQLSYTPAGGALFNLHSGTVNVFLQKRQKKSDPGRRRQGGGGGEPR